ncbi:PREDICTED: coiled-coil domain-containing protein 18-like [Amphimedon queenslandica]|uniref:DUSP domain-containing protein n=1 Tax=Amphimedon queenslandica TaxID=400682 RepID=A0AAN0J9T7_AMPQE|nr:PREDICTED: coiled-coil domain-containing protein 18-like [Amphimedon queenslandica]|eukprot:XP_019853800.1 PREDICTED: coiled-coil domain-containing protein 18-like [Amphimedon queenslandica]
MILEKLNEKEKQTQEAIEKRTKNHHVITPGNVDECGKDVTQLKAQVSSGLEKIAKRDKIIITQVQRIAELEREVSVTDAVVKALEDIKKEKEAEINSITLAYKKEKNKKVRELNHIKALRDAKETIKNLQNEMAGIREEQSRNEAIMFNQQAQLESCQQSLETARAANNKSLQSRLDELQRLHESILNERDELNDKYQSDISALTEINNVHMLQRRAQDLKCDDLVLENKMLNDDLVLLKAALDDTMFRIKEQQKVIDELLCSQEKKLPTIRNVIGTPLHQQKKIFDSLMKQKLVKDDIWCLVSCHWFEKWTKFIDIALKAGTDGCNKSSHPGPVTNFTLIKFINFQAPKLKKDLSESLDYKLIPEIGWDLLIQWYGISEKSMRLSRKVIKVQKHAIGKLMIEVYPVTVLVQLIFPESPDVDRIHYEVSRDDTVAFVIEKLRELLQVSAVNETHLWLQHLDKKVLLQETDTMGDNRSLSSVEDNDTLILEVKKGDKWTI